MKKIKDTHVAAYIVLRDVGEMGEDELGTLMRWLQDELNFIRAHSREMAGKYISKLHMEDV